jgi:hypothetical protein
VIGRFGGGALDHNMHKHATNPGGVAHHHFYKLTGEAPLDPWILTCIDGNSSLKSVDTVYRYGNKRANGRFLVDPCWIEAEEVDLFKDEVKKTSVQVSVGLFFNPSKAWSMSHRPLMMLRG